jgi:hypothetical protein
MKSFLKFFAYGIIFSGILLFLSFLLKFAPLDPKSGNIFSNGLITGLALIGWGANRIRSNQNLRGTKTDILYGVKNYENEARAGEFERMIDSQIPSALGLFLAGAVNLALSFLL